MSGQADFDSAFWVLLASTEPPAGLQDMYAVLKGFPGTPLTVQTVLADSDDVAAAIAGRSDELRRVGVISALRVPDD